MKTVLSDSVLTAPGFATDPAATATVKVLIVDDEEDARWVLINLVRQSGFVALPAANGEDALTSIERHSPSLVLLDIGLPDMDGFEVLERIRELNRGIRVIMITGNGKLYDAGRAVRAGAWDYITKPFRNADVIYTVRGALEENAAKLRLRRIAPNAQKSDLLLQSMGTSASIQGIQREVELVAKTNFSVLVTGESGSGKELVSQAIHTLSERASKAMVAVDCGAIAESLIESELFGHEKGAFTGAHQAKPGAFELANGGTIFLDEIGNLPLAMQGKLLRVLETRRITRIGSTREKKVDFRVVAATNANLLSMVEQKKFREDLYHRLAEYSIRIPPLRERKEDLVFLTQRFLLQTNNELGKQVKGLTVAAWGMCQRYDWHGNARELRNHLRRAVLLCDHSDGLILPEMLGSLNERIPSSSRAGLQMRAQGVPKSSTHEACPLCASQNALTDGEQLSLKELVARATAQVERAILLRVLEMSHGNKAEAARTLRIDYKTIHTKLKAYEISATQFMRDAYKAEA